MPLEVQLGPGAAGAGGPFEAEHEGNSPHRKRLQKARLIDHFNHKNVVFTMARRASGDCNFSTPNAAVHGV